MKLFVEFLQKQIFEDKLKDYKDIDFSLFVQTIPKSQEDLSSINIIVLFEPNEYFNMNDFLDRIATIKINKRFSLYNLPNVNEVGEGEAYMASFATNYHSASIKTQNELLKNNTYSYNSVKITMTGNISRGLQIFNVSIVN
jgi:hypothetical protein